MEMPGGLISSNLEMLHRFILRGLTYMSHILVKNMVKIIQLSSIQLWDPTYAVSNDAFGCHGFGI